MSGNSFGYHICEVFFGCAKISLTVKSSVTDGGVNTYVQRARRTWHAHVTFLMNVCLAQGFSVSPEIVSIFVSWPRLSCPHSSGHRHLHPAHILSTLLHFYYALRTATIGPLADMAAPTGYEPNAQRVH